MLQNRKNISSNLQFYLFEELLTKINMINALSGSKPLSAFFQQKKGAQIEHPIFYFIDFFMLAYQASSKAYDIHA